VADVLLALRLQARERAVGKRRRGKQQHARALVVLPYLSIVAGLAGALHVPRMLTR
jgi:hypothetical protein